jgi:PUA domain protein
MEIIHRHALRKSDVKELKEELEEIVGEEVEQLFKERIEIVKTEEMELYASKKNIIAFRMNSRLLPSLRALNDGLVHLPSVTVDMGAVPYVTNGADIMAPGITKVDDGLPKGAIVTIIDEKFGKSLAVGELLFEGRRIKEMNKGKAIKNLHYVNDEIWSLQL